jgi:RNA methyltransferase, TrmH family
MLSKARVKFITALQVKKYREIHRKFIAEGAKVVLDLLASQFKPDSIYATREWIADNVSIIGKLNLDVEEVTTSDLDRITALNTSSPVLAVFNIPEERAVLPDISKGLTLVLDDIRDPGNLGTIVRIADWFGIRRIICSETTVDLFNPKVVQGTMGSIARVEVFHTDLVSLFSNIPDGLPVYGTFLEGENIYTSELKKDAIIVIGNESRGISEEVEKFVSTKIFIPGIHSVDPSVPSAESLNASIATAIVFGEFFRGNFFTTKNT